MQDKRDIIIIGAGLTGLTLGWLLSQSKINFVILEARDRIGGRIYTHRTEEGAPVEMGATWLAPQHRKLQELLKELQIGTFEQQLGQRAYYEPFSTNPPQVVDLPPNQEPSYRVAGGTDQIIQTLAGKISSQHIITGAPVQRITLTDDLYTVSTSNRDFEAGIMVSTLPPNLLASTMDITPALPEDFSSIMHQTHTWMGESIKVSLRFKEPFWRSSSGTIFSNVGPVTEMYDHSNVDDDAYALKGFFNSAYHSVSAKEREKLLLQQLNKYFGTQVNDHIGYEELVWLNEPFTYAPYATSVLPHQNNGHTSYQQAWFNDRFFIAGSETSPSFPGYMEGAVLSAFSVFDRIGKIL